MKLYPTSLDPTPTGEGFPRREKLSYELIECDAATNRKTS